MNVLIIDDSPALRNQVRRILETEVKGSVVHEAWDGKSAIQTLTRKRIDYIISDLNMEGISGSKFLDFVKQNPLFHRKKILVFSSDVSEEILSALKDNPNIAFLEKSAGPEAVLPILISMREEMEDKAFLQATGEEPKASSAK